MKEKEINQNEIKQVMSEIKKIELPNDMRKRIADVCRMEHKERAGFSQRNCRPLGRPAIIVASMLCVVTLSGVTVLAASGGLQGFFRDVFGWNGAVTGTVYEQATEEISIGASAVPEGIAVELELLLPDRAPYRYLEEMAIREYEITDETGKVIASGEASDAAPVENGGVTILLPTQISGNAKLIVQQLEGRAKAEQPLPINGYWQCEIMH